MAYSSITKPGDYFNTKLYTGTDAAQSLTGVGFQPDWTWIKCRSHGGTNFPHILSDAVRGVNKVLKSNTNEAEITDYSQGYVSAFDSDGFTVTGQDGVSGVGRTYAAWNWKANGSGSANTDGTISSTVSANTTAGFSVVTFTGNGTSGATVGHGLGAIPKMYIVKRRETTGRWQVYHVGTSNTTPQNQYLFLDGDEASASATNRWNDTAPTSSVFSLGNSTEVNASGGTYVAYVFASVKGFSQFGRYIGSGTTDGTFVYTGFKPALVIIKKHAAVNEWGIWDNKRDTFNVTNDIIYPNLNNAEASNNSNGLDLVSNGFKLRASGDLFNSDATYLYWAVAENPLVANVSGGLPATAR